MVFVEDGVLEALESRSFGYWWTFSPYIGEDAVQLSAHAQVVD